MGGTDFLFSLEIHCAVVNGYKMNILMEILVMNCNTYEKVRSFCLEAKKGDQWKNQFEVCIYVSKEVQRRKAKKMYIALITGKQQ